MVYAYLYYMYVLLIFLNFNLWYKWMVIGHLVLLYQSKLSNTHSYWMNCIRFKLEVVLKLVSFLTILLLNYYRLRYQLHTNNLFLMSYFSLLKKVFWAFQPLQKDFPRHLLQQLSHSSACFRAVYWEVWARVFHFYGRCGGGKDAAFEEVRIF